jgi:hypothetical protein
MHRQRPEEDGLLASVREFLSVIPADFGGGCSVAKAGLLASLIRHWNLRSTVDIGVYRGRSLFPQAISHKYYTGGVVYGIDPWSAEEAWEKQNVELKELIGRFVRETDFEAVYREVEGIKRECRFFGHCALLRMTSAEAASVFEGRSTFFGLVHIDGNHDTERVTEDVSLYLPRITRGGFVVLDDVSWDSVRPAYEQLAAETTLVFERTEDGDDYAVFWKGDSPQGATARTNFCERMSTWRTDLCGVC